METTADVRVAAIAARQFGVVSHAQALTAGMTDAAVRHRVSTGRWGRMHRAVYRIAGSPPTHGQAVMAGWLAMGDDATVSHRTAGRLLRYPVRSDEVEVTIPAGTTRGRRGLVVHRSKDLSFADRTSIGPIVATSATRTLIDLAGVLGERRLIACIDFASSNRLTTPRYLRRRMEALGRNGRGNIALLEEILTERYPHDRAPDSFLERSVFDLIAELPGDPPILQYEVRLPDGRPVRLDAAWPAELLAIEADSYQFHSTKTAWSLDQTKRVVLVAMGWRILPITDFDVSERPAWVKQQVALARGLELAS